MPAVRNVPSAAMPFQPAETAWQFSPPEVDRDRDSPRKPNTLAAHKQTMIAHKTAGDKLLIPWFRAQWLLLLRAVHRSLRLMGRKPRKY